MLPRPIIFILVSSFASHIKNIFLRINRLFEPTRTHCPNRSGNDRHNNPHLKALPSLTGIEKIKTQPIYLPDNHPHQRNLHPVTNNHRLFSHQKHHAKTNQRQRSQQKPLLQRTEIRLSWSLESIVQIDEISCFCNTNEHGYSHLSNTIRERFSKRKTFSLPITRKLSRHL